MAKQDKNLWPALIDYSNLEQAFRKAAAFEEELESHLLRQYELAEGYYEPGAYLNFYIHDPKRRLISAAGVVRHF